MDFLKNFATEESGQITTIILASVGVVGLIICVVIVASVVTDANTSGDLTGINLTVAQYLPTIMILSGLALAGGIAYGYFKK